VISAQPYDGNGSRMAIIGQGYGEPGFPLTSSKRSSKNLHQVEGSLQRLVGGTAWDWPFTQRIGEAQQGKIFVESRWQGQPVYFYSSHLPKGRRKEWPFRSVLDRDSAAPRRTSPSDSVSLQVEEGEERKDDFSKQSRRR